MFRRTLGMAAIALIAAARPAFAHAHLHSAIPAPGSMLDEAPTSVSITFTEALEFKYSSIAVRDAAGARLDDGPAHAGPDPRTLVVALKPLPPGTYAVAWEAVSVDTHRTRGAFSFMVHG